MVNNDNDYQVPANALTGQQTQPDQTHVGRRTENRRFLYPHYPGRHDSTRHLHGNNGRKRRKHHGIAHLARNQVRLYHRTRLRPTGITPAAGKVFSLKDFTIKFAEGTVPQLNEESASQAYLLNSKNGNQVAATLAIGTNTTEIIATLAEEVSAEGNYTLVIPARMIQQTSMDEATAQPSLR